MIWDPFMILDCKTWQKSPAELETGFSFFQFFFNKWPDELRVKLVSLISPPMFESITSVGRSVDEVHSLHGVLNIVEMVEAIFSPVHRQECPRCGKRTDVRKVAELRLSSWNQATVAMENEPLGTCKRSE